MRIQTSNAQCPGTMVSTKTMGVSSCLGTLVLMSSCLRELVRITRSPEESMQRTGWCLGPRVRIAMVSSSSAWVGPLVCPVLRELVRVRLLWAPRSRVAGYPYLWAPVRITGVSSCLTIVLCG